MPGLPPNEEILNGSLLMVPENQLRNFRRHHASRVLLLAGHLLYKFTSYTLFGLNGKVSDYWSSVQPIAPGDPGFEKTLERAANAGSSPVDLVRARAAVRPEWNSMRGVVRARLKKPVYAFYGQCSGQQMDEKRNDNVFFIGGAWQLWIPHLTSDHIGLVLS